MASEKYLMEKDELAISLTKPATKLGVPILPFYLSMMTCFFGWMFYQAITGSSNFVSVFSFLMLWLLVYACMLLVTTKDIHGLMVHWVNFQHFRPQPNKASWGNTETYQP